MPANKSKTESAAITSELSHFWATVTKEREKHWASLFEKYENLDETKLSVESEDLDTSDYCSGATSRLQKLLEYSDRLQQSYSNIHSKSKRQTKEVNSKDNFSNHEEDEQHSLNSDLNNTVKKNNYTNQWIAKYFLEDKEEFTPRHKRARMSSSFTGSFATPVTSRHSGLRESSKSPHFPSPQVTGPFSGISHSTPNRSEKKIISVSVRLDD